MPTEVRRRRADQQGAQFVQLSAGRRHQNYGRIVHSRKRLGSVPEEDANRGAGEMLMRCGDDAVAPQITNGLCQWRDDPLQQSLRAQLSRTALEGVLERAGIE